MPKRKLISGFILFVSFITGCSLIQTAENLSRLKYKIQSASDYRLIGIDLKSKTRISDFSAVEILKLTASIAKGELPLTFRINIEAKNPNDGTGGYTATDISIKSFPWRLYINDNETISGNISEPILIPGKGESKIFPLEIKFDLVKNIKSKNIDDIIALALNIGGMNSSTSNLMIIAKPVIGSPIGDIKYPNEITIVDKTFN